jgi:quercetin dioxygenase-like cupin family protein
MRARRSLLLLPLAMLLSGNTDAPAPWQPPIGSNPVFDQALESATANRLIVADLRLGPNAVGEAHWHPWEEFLYVIEGQALVELEGEPQRSVVAGETFVIPPQVIHTPRAGPQGVRAIVVRVHREGDPVSVPATTPPTP